MQSHSSPLGIRQALITRIHHYFHAHPTTSPLLVLVIGAVVSGLIVGRKFISPFNLSLIIQQVTIIGILAIAQSLVILTAGIDLSVGAIMVLSSVVMGRLAVIAGVPVLLALPLGLLTGTIAGFINGIIIVRFRMPPFIVTLGTWSVYFALNLWYSKSETIRSQDIEAVAPLLQWLGRPIDVAGATLTYGAILMLLLFALFFYILNSTPFGRHIYAIGDDINAARLVGIRADRVLVAVYTVGGLICAIGGWALIGRIGSVSPQAGITSNIDSITAVVIGGISLFGGRGAIIGTLIGALIVGLFRNMLALAGVDVLWQSFTIGVLIIVSVAVDQWIRKVGR